MFDTSLRGLPLPQIFPAKARGLAGSVAVMTGWTSSFIVTLTFNYLLKWSAMGETHEYTCFLPVETLETATESPTTANSNLISFDPR